MDNDSWQETCTVTTHDDLEQRLTQLIELIELNGFEVLDGDFIRRDGTRSKYFLRPNSVDRLLNRLQDARKREQNTPT